MQELLRESLAEGAWGYSTGLEYAQEAGATEEEVAGALPRARRRRPLRDAHAPPRRGRSRLGRRGDPHRERAEVRLQVSHLVPRNGIEEARRSIELVERARARGLDVEFDMHTRRYGITHLYAALPPWALAAEPAELARAARATRRRATGCARTGASSAPATTGARIVLLDNPFWPRVRAPRPRRDRGRARPGAARRRLRPARAGASRSRTG